MAIKGQPNPTIMDTQRRLKQLGYDPIWVDGLWGPASESAFQKMYTEMRQQFIAWGTKFTDEELYHLAKMMRDEGFTGGVDSSDMMACIAFETDYRFSPSTRNSVSGATGLIQFMPNIALSYGTTVEELANMTVLQQIPYIAKHFRPYRKRLANLGDVYMSILWPRAVGQPDSYVLWKEGTTAYRQNSGLDLNKDGNITREKCLHKIKNTMVEGFDEKNRKYKTR